MRKLATCHIYCSGRKTVFGTRLLGVYVSFPFPLKGGWVRSAVFAGCRGLWIVYVPFPRTEFQKGDLVFSAGSGVCGMRLISSPTSIRTCALPILSAKKRLGKCFPGNKLSRRTVPSQGLLGQKEGLDRSAKF